ncbi:hypothetical protein QWJ34_26905, partial [Saccharibacillus sp. CPCC 101409]|nr:hypothetical protein [Saccharibacillus sp. CPCC 101409]
MKIIKPLENDPNPPVVETILDSTRANLQNPVDLAYAYGNLYILQTGDVNAANGKVWRLNLDSGSAEAIVSDLAYPTAITTDGSFDTLYIAETAKHRIISVGSSGTGFKVVAGTGEAGKGAEGLDPKKTALDSPQGVAVGDDGTLYISDTNNKRIMKIVRGMAAPGKAGVTFYDARTAVVSWESVADATDYYVYRLKEYDEHNKEAQWEEVAHQTSADKNEVTLRNLPEFPYFPDSRRNVLAVRAAKQLQERPGLTLFSEYTIAAEPDIHSPGPITNPPISEPPVSEPPTPVKPNPTPVTPTPSTPSTGGTSTPVTTAPAAAPAPSTQTSIVKVNVQNGAVAKGAVVSTLDITRTKSADGKTKDALQLTAAKAKEVIEQLKAAGSKTAAIVLPDPSDEVSEWNLTVPTAASAALKQEGIALVIQNPNVRIDVPTSSLDGVSDDLYFHLVPVKSTSTGAEIQQRALSNPAIVSTANGSDITVLGRPMTIETNLQSRPVTLTLPLPAGTYTAADMQQLGIYIEHSDGTKELVRGTASQLEDGKAGIQFTVNHFSTFTVVKVGGWANTLKA